MFLCNVIILTLSCNSKKFCYTKLSLKWSFTVTFSLCLYLLKVDPETTLNPFLVQRWLWNTFSFSLWCELSIAYKPLLSVTMTNPGYRTFCYLYIINSRLTLKTVTVPNYFNMKIKFLLRPFLSSSICKCSHWENRNFKQLVFVVVQHVFVSRAESGKLGFFFQNKWKLVFS